jgi:uncharacterized protein YggE
MQRPRLVLVTIVLALAAGAASAQTPAPRTIAVNGNAEIRVAPDEVILTLGVETNALDIAAARADNDRRVKAVVQAARAQGVPAELVKTDFLDIQPHYRDDDARRGFLGYVVRRSLVITVRDVPKFEPLLSAVLAAGANYVHGIEFRTTELRKHRDEARRLALKAAREKADAMAAALGATVGAPLTIQEGYSGWSSPYGTWWGARYGAMMSQNVVQEGARGGASDEAMVPGQISVTATVSVTFELSAAK